MLPCNLCLGVDCNGECLQLDFDLFMEEDVTTDKILVRACPECKREWCDYLDTHNDKEYAHLCKACAGKKRK